MFVGYSLPEADFEFRHLLKSAEKAVAGNTPKTIQVILRKDPKAEQRFRRFFGIAGEQIQQCGLSEFLGKRDLPVDQELDNGHRGGRA